MKKMANILALIISLFYINQINIKAYDVSSNNNPGDAYNGNGNNSVSGNTFWPENSEGKSLRAVRIRIFRGNTEISSAYYSLAENLDNCYSSVASTTLCETDSYNYSTVTEPAGTTCTAGENVSLGCIVSNNLLSTWGVNSSKGEYLDSYLKSDEYSNLKNILLGMGYNNTNFNNNDVVIVEPATLVKCNGANYFGTSTALMKKNVSYSGIDTNICYNSANSNSDKYPEGTFFNLYKSMSFALKISTQKSYPGDTQYTGLGYFKYNVSGMGYVDPNGDLKVEIYVDGTNPKQLITSESLTFNIRKGHGCTGAIEKKGLSTGASGFKTQNLLTGDYSIEITGKPSNKNYREKDGINYTCRNVTLTSSGAVVSIPFEKGCNIEKDEKSADGYTMSEAITLYNKYKFKGLLNTTNPTCSNNVNCNPQIDNLSCLSANLQSNISSTNFSCADIYTNASGNAVVFCGDIFSLVNNLSINGSAVKTFYGTSGEFLIKKDEETNLYRIYNSNNLPEYISAQNGIATLSSKRICYVLKNSALPQSYDSSAKIINAYLDNDELTLGKQINNPANTEIEEFNISTNEKIYNFDLNVVHLQKISGKVVSNSSLNTVSIIGLISKFKAEKGSIPFSIIYNSTEFHASDENTCKYILSPKIIDFSKDENGKISLEFRTVDTSQPFNRPTNSNWSDGSDNSADNSVVQEHIKNRPNSYGILNGEKKEPIYKIELTPDDIRLIRKYNKSNSYDNYLTIVVNYSGNSLIRNAFLYNLEQGKINDENLSNKLYNYKYSN